jgi:hypothetical protein
MKTRMIIITLYCARNISQLMTLYMMIPMDYLDFGLLKPELAYNIKSIIRFSIYLITHNSNMYNICIVIIYQHSYLTHGHFILVNASTIYNTSHIFVSSEMCYLLAALVISRNVN